MFNFLICFERQRKNIASIKDLLLIKNFNFVKELEIDR